MTTEDADEYMGGSGINELVCSRNRSACRRLWAHRSEKSPQQSSLSLIAMPPGKKKRAATRKAVANNKNRKDTTQARKRGGLWNLLDMPKFDVLLEVIHVRCCLSSSRGRLCKSYTRWDYSTYRGHAKKCGPFSSKIRKHCRLRAIKGLPPNPKHDIEPA